MKSIGKILLYVFAALAVIGFVWVLFSPNSAGADIDKDAWMGNPLTSYLIIVSLIAFAVTTIAFVVYKVVDLIKHPSHMRESLWVMGAILVAAIIGFVFSGSDEIANAEGLSYAGTQSKLIGTGLLMTGILLLVGMVFLIWDTIKGIIKG